VSREDVVTKNNKDEGKLHQAANLNAAGAVGKPSGKRSLG
jgi:uncharacterized membrane protein